MIDFLFKLPVKIEKRIQKEVNNDLPNPFSFY